MPKRVSWKKGMRLTDDVLRASDDCTAQLVGRAFALASAGRFGLCPSPRPFELSLSLSKGVADVETLSCVAITRDGSLIDAHYDTRYTNTFDTRVPLPDAGGATELLLVITADGRWSDTADGFEEQAYSFAFVPPDTPVADNAMPIARIVDDYGWRLDDTAFVPPCLLVSAHEKYAALLGQFIDVLTAIDNKARTLVHSAAAGAVRIFWPLVQNVRLTVDKERDTLTPMALMGNVQKVVSAFTCACELDEYLNLADAESFMAYVQEPYNYKDAYQKIKDGLDICFSINEKVGKMQEARPEPKPQHTGAPLIAKDQLFQNCRTRSVSIAVTGYQPSATVLYSTDGSEPAQKLPRQGRITVENNFNKTKTPEPDKTITVKLKAVDGGVESETAAYTVTLHKDYKEWNGYAI